MCHPACVILRRVIITICRRIKVTMLLFCASAIPPHLPHLPLSLSVSMVQPSHRVHVSWQCVSDSGPKEEKRGEWIIALDLNLLFFGSALTVPLLSSSCCVDHREEAQRPDQPQPVRAQEAGAQCFWEAGNSSWVLLNVLLLIKTTVSMAEEIKQLHNTWCNRVKCSFSPSGII